jgi:hypothetical protein
VYAVDCALTTLLDWQITDSNGEYTLTFQPQDVIVLYDPGCADGALWGTSCITDISSPGAYCFSSDHTIGECDNTCNLSLHIEHNNGTPWTGAFAVAEKCDGTLLDQEEANSSGVIELSFPSGEGIVCLNLRCEFWLCFADENNDSCLYWPGGTFESDELKFDTCVPTEQSTWGAIKAMYSH